MERITTRMTSEDTEVRLKDLLVSGLAGDALAYHTFLKGLSAHLRGFFRRRLTGLPDEVEDLVQETLLAVHNKRETYRHDMPATSWIHAIAHYKLVDMLRRRARSDALNEPFDDALEVFASPEDSAAEARHDLVRLLALLPDRQRLPILHVKLEGLSVAETAKLTGLSEPAVKIGVHRGLIALAVKLKER